MQRFEILAESLKRLIRIVLIALAGGVWAMLAISVPLLAQSTTVTASHLNIAGYPISTGTVFFTPVNGVGTPIPFEDATGALDGPTAYGAQITNGVIVGALTETGATGGTFSVPDASLTNPANILYNVTVCDRSVNQRTSGLCYTLPKVLGVSGATWALDHYGPPAITTTTTLQVLTSTTAPSACVPPTFWYNSGTGAIETCVGGVFVSPPGVGATTVSVGTTVTGAAGSSASVTNSGTSSAVILNFTIPQGATGATGAAAVTYNTTLSIPTGTLAANTCSSATNQSVTGVATSAAGSHVSLTYLSSPAALTGWGANGGIVAHVWPSAAATVSWEVCNQSGASITYSAITLSLGVQ